MHPINKHDFIYIVGHEKADYEISRPNHFSDASYHDCIIRKNIKSLKRLGENFMFDPIKNKKLVYLKPFSKYSQFTETETKSNHNSS